MPKKSNTARNRMVTRKKNNNNNRQQQVMSRTNLFESPIRTEQMLYAGRSPSTPGRASVRTVVPLKGGQQAFALSYEAFSSWFAYARNILGPYRYFRIVDLKVQVLPSGGAASVITTAFNVTNDTFLDEGAIAIMNDDYCAIANAITRPVLRPPSKFWREAAREWYLSIDSVAGLPSTIDRVAGAINTDTAGVAAGVECGYITAEMAFEFHTLM